MKPIRSWYWLVAALLLSVFAWPASAAKPQQAPDKSYGVEFLLPPTALDGTMNPSYTTDADGQRTLNLPVTVTVYVKNESPPSSAASNISSLSFNLSGLVPVGPPNCPRALCSVDTTTNTVYVTNISSPIQAQEAYPVTLQVNSCVVLGEAFISNVQAFTGSQFTGKPFTLFSGDTNFPNQQTLSTRAPIPFDFTQPGTVTVTGISCGNAACDLQAITVPNAFTGSNTSAMTIVRGPNADGACSASSFLDYFVTNNLWTPDQPSRRLHANWTAPAITPVFAYKLQRIGDVPGWQVGWLPKPGTPVLIDPPICFPGLMANEPTVGQLPFPAFIGVLSQDLKANAKKIKVDTSTGFVPQVPTGGLPIRIENEWMLLLDTSSTGWDVSRIAPVFHPAGSATATTPMQLLSNVTSPYTNNTPAQVCMVWQSSDTKTAWFMDGSDGWVLGR